MRNTTRPKSKMHLKTSKMTLKMRRARPLLPVIRLLRLLQAKLMMLMRRMEPRLLRLRLKVLLTQMK